MYFDCFRKQVLLYFYLHCLAEKTLFSPIEIMFGAVFLHATFLLLPFSVDTRDINFPTVSGIKRLQQPLTNDDDVDIATGSDFSGLMTFANLPYANCFSDSDVDAYDIAIMGAPFDTVSTPYRILLMIRRQQRNQSIIYVYTCIEIVKQQNIRVVGCE